MERKNTDAGKPTAAEYFAGIGLVRMGLELAGWRVAFANDWSHKKQQMYEAFFDGSNRHYLNSNIFDLTPDQIPATQLATCSFPCIDLSLAGKMNGIHGAHSSAFWGFVQILERQGMARPELLLLENVPGLITSNQGNDFRVTIQALNDLGYACDVFLLNARHFTPQSRRRIFVIGVRNSAHAFDDAVFSNRSPFLAPSRLKQAVRRNEDLNWITLPLPEPGPLLTEGLNSKIIEKLPEKDERWWPEEKTARHVQMMSDLNRSRVDELMANDVLRYRTFFRRRRNGFQRVEVRNDDIAGCLRTAVGGSSRQFLLRAGRGKIRMRNMTAREYARLQGVPDAHPIEVEENQALTGFGDAVCVPVIGWIARHVLNRLI